MSKNKNARSRTGQRRIGNEERRSAAQQLENNRLLLIEKLGKTRAQVDKMEAPEIEKLVSTIPVEELTVLAELRELEWLKSGEGRRSGHSGNKEHR